MLRSSVAQNLGLLLHRVMTLQKCGDGQMIFNCDAPFGGADRLMIYIFGPLSIIIISILTYLVAKKPRRMQIEL